jgi:large subunit ribosomal protein L29
MPTADELRELDDDELDVKLAEGRRELLNLRFQLATGQLDNAARLPVARREVARVLTIIRDREIALAEGRDAGPVIIARPVRPPRPPRRSRTKDEEVLDEDALAGDDEVEDLVVDDEVEDDDVADAMADENEEDAGDDEDDEDEDAEGDEEDQ